MVKLKYIGDAQGMNYILGIVEPNKIYDVKEEYVAGLLGGPFIKVKEVVVKNKKDGD